MFRTFIFLIAAFAAALAHANTFSCAINKSTGANTDTTEPVGSLELDTRKDELARVPYNEKAEVLCSPTAYGTDSRLLSCVISTAGGLESAAHVDESAPILMLEHGSADGILRIVCINKK